VCCCCEGAGQTTRSGSLFSLLVKQNKETEGEVKERGKRRRRRRRRRVSWWEEDLVGWAIKTQAVIFRAGRAQLLTAGSISELLLFRTVGLWQHNKKSGRVFLWMPFSNQSRTETFERTLQINKKKKIPFSISCVRKFLVLSIWVVDYFSWWYPEMDSSNVK
jgi:hypothetical protein